MASPCTLEQVGGSTLHPMALPVIALHGAGSLITASLSTVLLSIAVSSRALHGTGLLVMASLSTSLSVAMSGPASHGTASLSTASLSMASLSMTLLGNKTYLPSNVHTGSDTGGYTYIEALDGAVTLTTSGGLAGGAFSQKPSALLLAGVDPKELMPICQKAECRMVIPNTSIHAWVIQSKSKRKADPKSMAGNSEEAIPEREALSPSISVRQESTKGKGWAVMTKVMQSKAMQSSCSTESAAGGKQLCTNGSVGSYLGSTSVMVFHMP